MLSRILPAPGLDDHDSSALVGRPAGRGDLNAAERTLVAAAWIRASADALEASRGDLGAAVPSGPVAIGLIDRHLRYLVDAPAGRDVVEIASDLSVARATGQFVRIQPGDHLAAPLVVVTDRRQLSLARRAHRTNGLEGPWGCVARASRTPHPPPMELLSADVDAVPVERQVRLAQAILTAADHHVGALEPSVAQWLGREMTRTYVDAWRPPEWGFQRPAGTRREELASIFVDRAPTDLAALQAATDRVVGPLLAGRAPTAAIQVSLIDGGDAPYWKVRVAAPLPDAPTGSVSVVGVAHAGGAGSVHVLAWGDLAETAVMDRIVEEIERALA